MEITKSIHRIPGFVNQYLIIEPGSLTLIDTGMPKNGKKIVDYIQSIGEKPERLERILITHADGDHFGAVNELAARTPAKVYAGAVEAEAMRKGDSSRKLTPHGLIKVLFALAAPLFKVPPSRVDEILEPGQTLPVLGGLQVIDTRGHTPGHLSFFLPAERVLFTGDSVQISSGQTKQSTGANTWDMDLARASYQKQVDLKPKFWCCGHGFLAV